MALPPFLNNLRQRPGIYIGRPSLTRLFGFLLGYDTACHDFRATPADPFFLGFQEWIERRLQSGHIGWTDAILQHTKSEKDAFDRFWELYDEYLAESKNGAPLVEQQHNGTPRVEQESRP